MLIHICANTLHSEHKGKSIGGGQNPHVTCSRRWPSSSKSSSWGRLLSALLHTVGRPWQEDFICSRHLAISPSVSCTAWHMKGSLSTYLSNKTTNFIYLSNRPETLQNTCWLLIPFCFLYSLTLSYYQLF